MSFFTGSDALPRQLLRRAIRLFGICGRLIVFSCFALFSRMSRGPASARIVLVGGIRSLAATPAPAGWGYAASRGSHGLSADGGEVSVWRGLRDDE